MSLSAGVRVGPYEIIEPLGAGGMGQVWRARDTRLRRDVAVKVLPDEFAADPDRLERFERESQVLAALNHPHIATIHGIEDLPVGRALVMEVVPGPTLTDRIAQGALPPGEALPFARDIADAFESAHERGIVHRDLKPANLKLTADNRVKVLDFGLAKAAGGSGGRGFDISHSPTVAATLAGTLMGTAAYMSPEQARGASVDRRADIWAFGCVLYELLTGRRAFDGESVTDVLAAVVRAEPDWTALPGDTPEPVRRLLERCLRKDPRQRLRDIGDARLVLEDVMAGREEHAATPPRTASRAGAGVHATWAAVSLAALVVGAWGTWQFAPEAPAPVRKLEITVADPMLSTWTRPRISPDGHAVAYGAADRLWIRRLDQLEPREVPGSQTAESPIWSPDGTQLAFTARRKLWKVGAAGGEPMAVCDLPGTGRIIGGAWRPDGAIVFSSWFGPLHEVSAAGGDPKVLLAPEQGEVDFHEPALLPDGRTVLFVPHTGADNFARIEALREGRRTSVVPAQRRVQFDSPRYSPTGHLLYARQAGNDGVWAVPFSPERLETTGESFRVVGGAWLPDAAGDGTLIYTAGRVSYELHWIDRSGRRLGPLGDPLAVLADPALSPDGRWVAVVGSTEGTLINERRLWLYEVATGRREQLPASPVQTNDGTPAWSPDGQHLVYVELRRSPPVVVWRRVGSSELPRVLATGDAPSAFAPDGKQVAFTRRGATSGSDVWVIPFPPQAPDTGAKPLLDGPSNEGALQFAPGGRAVAYHSDEAGRLDVYLRRYPLTDERWTVSPTGGTHPKWNGSGTELFYRALDGSTMVVNVTLGPSIAIGEPRQLFDEAISGAELRRELDVTRDGQRFLVIARARGGTARIVVVQNWFSEFQDAR